MCVYSFDSTYLYINRLLSYMIQCQSVVVEINSRYEGDTPSPFCTAYHTILAVREKIELFWRCMSRLMCFLMKIGTFYSKMLCLRTILQEFCVLRTNLLRTAYSLTKPEYCVPKRGVTLRYCLIKSQHALI